MCEDNCVLLTTADVQGKGFVITLDDNDDTEITIANSMLELGPIDNPIANPQNPWDWQTNSTAMLGHVPVTMTEQGPNSGVFGSYDESDDSVIIITNNAGRGTSASIDYNETPATILVGFSFGSIDIVAADDEWNSGEEVPVVLVDADANLNSRADEDLDFNDPQVDLIPALSTGSPATLQGLNQPGASATFNAAPLLCNDGSLPITFGTCVQQFSDRAMLSTTGLTSIGADNLILTYGTYADFFNAAPVDDSTFQGVALYNYDLRSFGDVFGYANIASITFTGSGQAIAGPLPFQGTIQVDNSIKNTVAPNTSVFAGTPSTTPFVVSVVFAPGSGTAAPGTVFPTASDVIGFGFSDDGVETNERVSNQIIRLELEETGDNTSTFEGTLEYTMVNQLNILDPATYAGLTTIADDPTFIVIEDLTDEDSPRVNYLDLGADGVSTQVSDQEEAPSHSGIVSFDNDSYKIADTVTITLEDSDLNVDVDLIDIFTVVNLPSDDAHDQVGAVNLPTDFSFGDLGRLLDVTFDDSLWTTPAPGTCTSTGDASGDTLKSVTDDTGLGATGFSLIETDAASGIFIGDFQIPPAWCNLDDQPNQFQSTTGLDIEVNYVDFRDASGEIIEVGDSAGIRANTGSVSLDRTV
jgi:hypothetical protein